MSLPPPQRRDVTDATPPTGYPVAPYVSASPEAMHAIVHRFWGFDTLRPLQERAIDAGVHSRDSLVVLPTGGGKSLCYQVPPVVAERTDIVVSPLISLMKDQVDGLTQRGYRAVALHSAMMGDEAAHAEHAVRTTRPHLIYVAPERLFTDRFLQLIAPLSVRTFVVDEAHAISHWGHDFRPDYRALSKIKDEWPAASINAYTATATPRVREDIITQLRLHEPVVLLGDFDRPNLHYRVQQRTDVDRQVLDIILRHKGRAVIVYCFTRRDTENLASALCLYGIKAAHYHAGLDAETRRETQDAFASAQIDVVTATIAFGMGIDRSDVRCVIHTNMPKSIEHYQQETGRAGRDGAPAECILLYSPADVSRWEMLLEMSAYRSTGKEYMDPVQRDLLWQMRDYCVTQRCRHAQLSEYFGQPYINPNCGACDVCAPMETSHVEASIQIVKARNLFAGIR